MNTQKPYFNYTEFGRDADLNEFFREVQKSIQFLDSLNPYAQNPLFPMQTRIDHFLQKHNVSDYEHFLKNVDFDEITTNDYALLGKRGIKKRLFDYRAKVYLDALAKCEAKGMRLETLIPKIQFSRIPSIKKETQEPTFEKIRQSLRL